MGTIESVVVRPLSLGIEARIGGHKVTFTLPGPANISVEINGNIRRPLFIFANPLETNRPKSGDPGIIHYGPGRIHNAGLVELKSGDTVYIAGGAIVRGAFIAENADDITIMGRGVLDGSGYHKGERRMIEMLECKNIRIKDIVIFNSGHWTVPLKKCDTVNIKNLKIVNWRDWDDGIDICGSSNVTISNSFIRTKDDCVAIKSVYYRWMTGDGIGDVKNVIVQNSVLWNGVWGNGLEIGFETRAESISDIVFRDNDLIHVEGREGTFTIHNGDRAKVSNVLYENIRVEDSVGYLIDFKILESRYSKDTERGRIENIRFNNIDVVGDVFPASIMRGFDNAHSIDGVAFSNFRIHGTVILSEEQLKLEKNEFVKGLRF
jgi:polygalacturonase